MARTAAEDQIQGFRFRVFEIPNAGGIFSEEDPVAGFTTITTPEITMEIAPHRTGSEHTTKKLAGPVEYGDGTMTRGILRGDTTLYGWILKYLTKQPFRTDLEIRVYGQDGDGGSPDEPYVVSQVWRECVPTSVKPLGDLDSSSAEANIQEITVSIEELVLDNPAD